LEKKGHLLEKKLGSDGDDHIRTYSFNSNRTFSIFYSQ
jgi:hypothetical protein